MDLVGGLILPLSLFDCALKTMKPPFTSSILALATVAAAAPTDERLEARATPTVYLAGDSTMAKGGGGAQTEAKVVSGDIVIIEFGHNDGGKIDDCKGSTCDPQLTNAKQCMRDRYMLLHAKQIHRLLQDRREECWDDGFFIY
ncbi:hypothetical protein M7I_8213 [Glarea lozoyensis 74030]|uniref:SGNH hydrolase-type esterase domain-containing protein n=1 Tax=Glarea lozoyensis (strain ATCC 74030 / MF5533) TaxID=1104152 RepID=H0EZE8_GLAL7|nr:hypothetical protein M7I_8213 [Glarea lozoyensis 74030]